MATIQETRLALEGGTPAIRHPLPPMYPGGMRIGREEEEAVLEVLRSKRLFRYYGPEKGPSKVADFEAAFAQHMGSSHAIATASGTTAITSALAALGVGPGDDVIIPGYTWISSAAGVLAVGAVPVIAEVDQSLTLDPADVEAKITSCTKVIIPVHLRGVPCDMDKLTDVARRHNVKVLEDVAQADGGSYRGKRLGTIGDIGIFSLQFNKIITSGEGGMVITDDRTLHERALMYHDVAASQRAGMPREETFVGITCRMSELQGAVCLVQLGRLDPMLDEMRAHKAAIKDRIAEIAGSKGIQFTTINDPEGDTGIALVFFAPTAERARWVVEALNAEGVPAGILFNPERSDYHVYYHWTPILEKRHWSTTTPWDLHQREIRYEQNMCPRTLDLLGRAVHLDISPDLSEQNVQEISEGLIKVLSSL